MQIPGWGIGEKVTVMVEPPPKSEPLLKVASGVSPYEAVQGRCHRLVRCRDCRRKPVVVV